MSCRRIPRPLPRKSLPVLRHPLGVQVYRARQVHRVLRFGCPQCLALQWRLCQQMLTNIGTS